MDAKIKRFVFRVRERLREQQIVTNLINFAGCGMILVVLISLIALLVPFYHAALVSAGTLLLSFVIGMIRGIRKTPNPMEAALRVDAKGYQERISTAFYLSDKQDAFSILQKKDAVRIVDTFQIRKEFPIRLQWKRVWGLLLLTVVFVVSSFIDTPAKRTASIRHDVKQEVEESIARLEKVEKEIAKNNEIPENEAADIKEQLENARKELEEAESYEDLKKAQERITKKMEMASQNVKDKTLSDIMQAAVKESKEAEEKKEEELAEEAKEALEKAAQGSDKDKEEAYEKLKKLAQMTGDSNLSQAAENYKASSYSDSQYAASSQALSEAIQNMEMKNTDFANNNSSNNNASSNNSTSASNSSNLGSNNSNSNNNSNSSQNGNQNNSGNQNGSPSDGNGTENGSGSGSGNGSGSGSGNGSGGGWNYGSKDGQEGARKTNENITVPDGEVGEDDNLTGKANGNDSSTKEKSNQSKTWSGNKVSYGDVSGEYKEKAYNKINGSNYPGKMKDIIRDYFDGLN